MCVSNCDKEINKDEFGSDITDEYHWLNNGYLDQIYIPLLK